MLVLAVLITATLALEAKTLVAYYSFTNNVRQIVNDMKTQLKDADVVEVEPAEEGLDYAANNYKIGSALISAINKNPNDASSYPAIKSLNVDWSKYDEVVVATPLWWSHMAAPMQTFLFENGKKMAGKRIGLLVSSASSTIEGVEADAKRLIPDGNFLSPSLWIRSSQMSSLHSMVASWIASTGIGSSAGVASVGAKGSAWCSLQGSQLFLTGDFDLVTVLDASGRLLLTSRERNIDLSGLSPNVYVVQMKSGSAVKTSKVVLNK